MQGKESLPLGEAPSFEKVIIRKITNAKTGEICTLNGGREMSFKEEDFRTIAEKCSQKEIFDLLFKERFGEKGYTEENARQFVDWVCRGWREKSHFVFFVRNDVNNIIGAIDIKSANLEVAEVGYWADRNNSGFMTNTLKELTIIAQEAGYKKLVAKVLTTNDKSFRVLERANFTKVEEEKKSDKIFFYL